MFDEDPAAEGGQDVGIDNARSPAPDAAPEDNPEPDALSGDVDIKSGTGDPDLAYPEQVDGLVDRVEADGPVDILVNNAGLDEVGCFPATPAERLATILQVNLAAPMALCRQAIPRMLERGGGHLVNVSSLAGDPDPRPDDGGLATRPVHEHRTPWEPPPS